MEKSARTEVLAAKETAFGLSLGWLHLVGIEGHGLPGVTVQVREASVIHPAVIHRRKLRSGTQAHGLVHQGIHGFPGA